MWFDDLGISPADSALAAEPCAWLLGADRAGLPVRTSAAHASHKGSFGDVAVLGGESTATTQMTGAALLAASAALHAGAGRVFVALLGNAPGMKVDPEQPELMFRAPEAVDMAHQVVVCGCGGGESVKTVLAKVLSTRQAGRAGCRCPECNCHGPATANPAQSQARSRLQHGIDAPPAGSRPADGQHCGAVQADRLVAAGQLAERFQCVVVLKGSGTVIAAPGQTPVINATGNALLATAGTGDVLAGMLGACLARGMNDVEAACSAVFAHGHRADTWASDRPGKALTASALAQSQTG